MSEIKIVNSRLSEFPGVNNICHPCIVSNDFADHPLSNLIKIKFPQALAAHRKFMIDNEVNGSMLALGDFSSAEIGGLGTIYNIYCKTKYQLTCAPLGDFRRLSYDSFYESLLCVRNSICRKKKLNHQVVGFPLFEDCDCPNIIHSIAKHVFSSRSIETIFFRYF